MADFNITCSEATLKPVSYNSIQVNIEDCDIPKFIEGLSDDTWDEFIDYAVSRNSPEELYDRKDLEKWAEENGYTKENN